MMSSDDGWQEETDDECLEISRGFLPGRRDIHEIKQFHQLFHETRAAKYEELQRILRISEFEKELDKLFPNGEAKNRMILDFDDETKEPIVTIHPQILMHLKDHQREGIKFMWKICFERASRTTQPGTGCILAHCMGLGKTLQVIALIYTLLTNPRIKIKKILILAPKNTLLNWVHEFDKWIRQPMIRLKVFNPARGGSFHYNDLEDWSRIGGVCVMSYTKYRLLIEGAKKDSNVLKILSNPGPDFLVCDEGHVLKNHQSKLCISLKGLATTRRVLLSGTPLQNNLLEYYSMVNFARPYLLGTRAEFSNMFANPITNGQFYDSYSEDVTLMKARSHVLHKMLTTCVQRFDFTTLTNFLYEKREFVLKVRLTESQVEAYQHYLDLAPSHVTAPPDEYYDSISAGRLFADFQMLQHVWTHPYSMKLYDAQPIKPRKAKILDEDDDEYVVERPAFWTPGWWLPFFDPDVVNTKEASAKIMVLFDIIQYCFEKREKIQSLVSLRVIEHFLRIDRDDGMSGWVENLDYFVLTGASSTDERHTMCQKFNDPNNKRIKVFLISTKAGGLGITLNAANRAVIFDACWNPSHDIQSIFRIYRLGQKKQCYIYRLIASGTMEEKIYERQVTKQSTSHRVIDEKQIARHYTANELRHLYQLQPDRIYNNLNFLHKDELLKLIVEKHPQLVAGYHEHDSLLVHKLDEELLDIEKQGAWNDFGEDTSSVISGAMAIGKLMTFDVFRINNFKVILRRMFPHLPEHGINNLVTQLMPRVKELFASPNFSLLMAQEALKACVAEQKSDPAVTQISGKPKPIQQWGTMGGRSLGKAPDDEIDSD